VGVSTDELVVEYKGRAPVVPFDERIEIVRAIRFVSRAVPQEKIDKIQAWEALKFDTWVVGSDHEKDPKYQAYKADLLVRGVTSHFAPYTMGVSTTLRRGTATSERLR